MAKLEFTVEIEAPPERVFLFFVPQRMPYWYGAEMKSQFEVQGGATEFQAGQKVRVTGRLGRREVTQTNVVTRYEWGRVLEWRFQDAYGVRGLERWELEPLAGSTPCAGFKTRVRLRNEYEFPGWLGRVVDRLVTRRAVARRHRDYLQRLKKLGERQ
jgi:uncharacterized protein YndB with AHSA1/START domain